MRWWDGSRWAAEGYPPPAGPYGQSFTDPNATKPWYKKKRWQVTGAVVAVFMIAGAASSGGAGADGDNDVPSTVAAEPNSSQESTADTEPTSQKKSKSDKPEPKPQPEPEPEPELTTGQQNALAAGQNYIDIMPFSKAGLVRQLSSPAGDDYSKADATFAANNVDADWNAEAVEAAQNYLDMMPFSKNGLIQQLSSSAGDQFTPEQARYAANQVL